ncbi:hypothetical protein ACHAWU_009587 [Discostella pseudostelligera]|uniref:Uncharacterized protein n=1 Tax=Discostella pseudostelligera TaxID=259834 RepID=A0ABD3MAD1_9STRA
MTPMSSDVDDGPSASFSFIDFIASMDDGRLGTRHPSREERSMAMEKKMSPNSQVVGHARHFPTLLFFDVPVPG